MTTISIIGSGNMATAIGDTAVVPATSALDVTETDGAVNRSGGWLPFDPARVMTHALKTPGTKGFRASSSKLAKCDGRRVRIDAQRPSAQQH
jgi:hypothetical protein